MMPFVNLTFGSASLTIFYPHLAKEAQSPEAPNCTHMHTFKIPWTYATFQKRLFNTNSYCPNLKKPYLSLPRKVQLHQRMEAASSRGGSCLRSRTVCSMFLTMWAIIPSCSVLVPRINRGPQKRWIWREGKNDNVKIYTFSQTQSFPLCSKGSCSLQEDPGLIDLRKSVGLGVSG